MRRAVDFPYSEAGVNGMNGMACSLQGSVANRLFQSFSYSSLGSSLANHAVWQSAYTKHR
jgi:hypothetical protein